MAVKQSAALRGLATLAWGGVRVYRVVLSPLLGGACRFSPSCSIYAEQALTTWPLHRAVWRIISRLGCCHPWHPGGLDPVMPSFAEVPRDK